LECLPPPARARFDIIAMELEFLNGATLEEAEGEALRRVVEEWRGRT
jgi:hypothetical protein